jgi:hypothetical protein
MFGDRNHFTNPSSNGEIPLVVLCHDEHSATCKDLLAS